MMTKSYSELRTLQTFEERYEYLRIGGQVGVTTFGFERYLNQVFYRSREWRYARDKAIARDNGCDLGIIGREIYEIVYVHHINPITIEDIERGSPLLFDLNNLITTIYTTHQAIHYGDKSLLRILPPERRKGDTTLW